MNKFDYYEKLKLTLNDIQIDELTTSKYGKLSKIISHPSFIKTHTLPPNPASSLTFRPVNMSIPVFAEHSSSTGSNPNPLSSQSAPVNLAQFRESMKYRKHQIQQLHNTPASITSSSASSLFGSHTDVKRCPDDIINFVKLLDLFSNKQYGHRWKILKCYKYTKLINNYDCNNINYDKNDLKYNSYVINKCENSDCMNYDNMIQKIYNKYINKIIQKQTYPYDQITDIDLALGEYRKIINYISKIKNKNPFNNVIIIDSVYDMDVVLVAYDKFKSYKLNSDLQEDNYNIQLNDNNKIILSNLDDKTNSNYGKIFKGNIQISNKPIYFAIKLSLCDNITSDVYKKNNQVNLNEIHLFDIVTKYAILKININLPIIYKTIQLDVDDNLIIKLFYQNFDNKTLAMNEYKTRIQNCNLGNSPTVNCSISELYTGSLEHYISNFYLRNDYLKYSISALKILLFLFYHFGVLQNAFIMIHI